MQALEGIKVVDMTQAQFGPEACMTLADLGADVVKIEPIEGEWTRPVTKEYDTDGINAYFLSQNRNKRGIALDFRKEKGKKIIYKLVERSDIFVTTWGPGTMKRRGFDYEQLRKINPKLIYCQGSAYGPKGPLKDWRGVDINIQGWSGLAHITGDGDGPVGTSVIDVAGGLALALGAMVALYVREKTGKGQLVTASLLQIGLYLLAMEYASYLLSGKEPPKAGKGHSIAKGLYHAFPAKDKPIILGGVNDDIWPSMCKAMGLEKLINDPRFDNSDSRVEHIAELVPILDTIFRTKSADEWLQLLWPLGVRISPVLSLSEALGHRLLGEQIKANEYVFSMEAGSNRKVQVISPVVELSETPCSIRRPGFCVGEHNREILLELGYTLEDIDELRNEKVI